MKKVITLSKSVSISTTANVVGKKEGEGPLADKFDMVSNDDYFNQESWEKAESFMQQQALDILLQKKGITQEDISVALGGDLSNQITSTNFAFRNFSIPFLGIYSACSTLTQSIAIACCLVSSELVDNALVMASSHFCTAERQFRTPLDYGAKRTPSSQWTVTGAGCLLIEKNDKPPFVKRICFGTVTDLDVTDPSNMGAAMAPAAARTIIDFLSETNQKTEDYDMIFTGDLGDVGSKLLKNILKQEGIELKNHNDCGLMIFDRNTQDVQSGASGVGCSTTVLTAKIIPDIISKKYKRILMVATGALLSTTTSLQKESIPSIAHLVEITAERE